MTLQPSDWISISSLAVSAIGIVVSALVAIWIVDILQRRHEYRHQLNDHLSKEVLSVREQYRQLIRNLMATEQRPKQIVNEFKITGIYVNDLLILLHSQYGTPTDILQPYQTELLSIVTDCEEYNQAYSRNKLFRYRKSTINSIQKFEKSHDKLFNNILLTIYNEKKN